MKDSRVVERLERGFGKYPSECVVYRSPRKKLLLSSQSKLLDETDCLYRSHLVDINDDTLSWVDVSATVNIVPNQQIGHIYLIEPCNSPQ